MPCAFVSGTSPVSRALLVLCINQGISASFSLSLSYCQLQTTRFWSIKGPQTISSNLSQNNVFKAVFDNLERWVHLAQTIKHLPTVWENWVRSLGQEDPLEKGMAIHSSTLAWKIPWTEKRSRLQSMGSQRVGHDWATTLFPFFTALNQ